MARWVQLLWLVWKGQIAGKREDWSFPEPKVRPRVTGDSPIPLTKFSVIYFYF